jgi:DNA-binding transcriptional ArsR family regulator
MLLVLELDVADLAATRFAISPLSETLRAVQLLGDRETPAVNAPWVRWARSELGWRPLRLPRLWPLIVNGLPTHPEFLVPAPESRMPELGAELARLRATPAEAVRASLHRVWVGHPWPESAKELAAQPRESLAEIAAEIDECYRRLIAPRGAATVWEGGAWAGSASAGEGGGREEAAEALLGAPRVRLLAALRSPATTTALARRLGVTPSAVSQHLAVLHRGGLVDKRRSGRTVLYQTTALGLALLGAGSASSGASAS